jgi:hypothetical protein
VNQDFVLGYAARSGSDRSAPTAARCCEAFPVYVAVKTVEDKDLSVLDHITAMVFPFGSSVDLVGPLAGGKPQAGKLWTVAKTMPSAVEAVRDVLLLAHREDRGRLRRRARTEWPTPTRDLLKSAYPCRPAAAGMSAPIGKHAARPNRASRSGCW